MDSEGRAYERAYRAQRLDAGLCRCGQPMAVQRASCASCLARTNARAKAIHAAALADGVCTSCYSPALHWLCDACACTRSASRPVKGRSIVDKGAGQRASHAALLARRRAAGLCRCAGALTCAACRERRREWSRESHSMLRAAGRCVDCKADASATYCARCVERRLHARRAQLSVKARETGLTHITARVTTFQNKRMNGNEATMANDATAVR